MLFNLLFSLSLQLVCTSLEELRDLISKTEDELDDLESTKKRLVGHKHSSVVKIVSRV